VELDPHLIIRHIHGARCGLAQGFDTKVQAIPVPLLLLNLKNRQAGSHSRQPWLQPPQRLFFTQGMRDGDD
jgi:hypothetical protein